MTKDKTIILLLAVGVSLVIGLTVTVLGFSRASDSAHEALLAANQAHRALCAIKEDDVKRLHDAKQFLNNPNEFPGIKIPVAVVKNSIHGLEHQTHDLKDVTCP